MEWITSYSTVEPDLFDTRSSKKYNYARRNIEQIQVEDPDAEEPITLYRYEECKVKKDVWTLFIDQEQAKADIEYLMMITEDM